MDDFLDFQIGVDELVIGLDQAGVIGMWSAGTELSAKTGAAPGSDGAMPPGSGSIKARGKKAARKSAKAYENLVMKGRP